jgi:hypothetical protein
MSSPNPAGPGGREPEFDASARFVARHRSASCRLGSESVVLDIDQGKYFGLNDVAARVYELLERPHALAELRDAIVAEYEVAPETCESDVRLLLRELLDLGLIEMVGGPPRPTQ